MYLRRNKSTGYYSLVFSDLRINTNIDKIEESGEDSDSKEEESSDLYEDE